jgi:NAD(P)-dependent dehydrogenase (short-subunit alcohol dehydrogenase family)
VQAYRGLGYAVVANSRTMTGESNPEVVAVAGDIGERAVAEEVVRTAMERFGRIDTLINNAGIFIGKPFTDYTVEDFERVLHVNVAGFFHVTQCVVPHMLERRGGHIISRDSGPEKLLPFGQFRAFDRSPLAGIGTDQAGADREALAIDHTLADAVLHSDLEHRSR